MAFLLILLLYCYLIASPSERRTIFLKKKTKNKKQIALFAYISGVVSM